jgi:small subunit ribosomal protein S6e
MNIVISDPKTGKAFSKKIESASNFSGRKIGQEIQLDSVGLNGYSAKITGGSDKDGFPMKKDLTGTSRRRVFVVVDRKKGEKNRITKRGNTVADDIKELNVVVTKYGSTSLEEMLGKKDASKEEKLSVKEEMVKKSLDVAGTQEAAKAMSGIKFKKGEVKEKDSE